MPHDTKQPKIVESTTLLARKLETMTLISDDVTESQSTVLPEAPLGHVAIHTRRMVVRESRVVSKLSVDTKREIPLSWEGEIELLHHWKKAFDSLTVSESSGITSIQKIWDQKVLFLEILGKGSVRARPFRVCIIQECQRRVSNHTFFDFSGLRRHMKRSHGVNGGKYWACFEPRCGFKTAHKDLLEQHFASHKRRVFAEPHLEGSTEIVQAPLEHREALACEALALLSGLKLPTVIIP